MSVGRPFERATASDTLAAILHERTLAASKSGRLVPAELARVLVERLSRLPQDGGLEPRSLDAALEPVMEEEAARTGSTTRSRANR